MNRISKIALLLSAGLAATSSAQVALLQGINPALDNSAVPGIEDARLGGTLDWTGLTGSPDGSLWTFNAFLTTGSTLNDEVIVLGNGPSTASLTAVAREDADASGAVVGVTWSEFDTPRVNDMGTVVFAGEFGVLPTGENDFIVTWNSGSLALVAKESDDSSGVFGAGTFFDTLDTAVIDNDNRVGYRVTSIDGVPTANDSAIVFNGSVLVQELLTAIDGELWQVLDLDDFRVSADGQTWLLQGDTDAGTTVDDIVAVNNIVVMREGNAHPALPLNVALMQGIEMTASGDWFIDGDMTDDRDFVVRNNALIALVDDPTGLSTGENWDDTNFSTCFFMQIGNSVGDYIVGGLTNSTDSTADAVLVLNGTTEAMRENDPVDLDGNGMFDDDQFIGIFHNDDAVLTNDLKLYVLVTLRDGAGVETGEALIYKDLSGGAPTCPGDIADDFGSLGADGMVSFGDFLALLGLVGPCPGMTPGCPGDIADDFGTLNGGDGMVSFGDFLALLGLVGPCP